MKNYPFTVADKYLQTIYTLLEDQKTVKSVKLTRLMNASPSTVHATLYRMQRDQLIVIDQKKEVSLTDLGTDRAIRLVRRRRLTERLLCEKLDIPLLEVRHHVGILAQGLTPLIEEKLMAYLGHPKTCPHGKPIPLDRLETGIANSGKTAAAEKDRESR